MTELVVVPVRYPLSSHSERTLGAAREIAAERGAALTVLHINLYQSGKRVERRDLKRTVESTFGTMERTRYVVRKGFLVEEAILEEVAAEGADVVVIGRKQVGRWRRALSRLFDDPDIEGHLREHLDCEVVVAGDS